MFGLRNKTRSKYVLMGLPTKMNNPVKDLHPHKMYRIKAIRDIPEHGVRKGDLGGFVFDASTLSHEGSCWVGGQAQAIYNVRITGDAYIGGNAVVDGEDNYPVFVTDNVRIEGNAQVLAWKKFASDPSMDHRTVLKDDFNVFEDAIVRNLKLGSGDAAVYGRAVVTDADEIGDESYVSGKSTVLSGARILGKSVVTDSCVIEENAVIRDLIVQGSAEVLYRSQVSVPALEQSIEEGKNILEISSATVKVMEMFNEVVASIDSYETDIVKIIKYPVMTDRTDSFTRKMASALNVAKRLASNPEDPEFKDAVLALEDAFLAAESNAIKVLSTSLSDAEKKKTELAKDLFAVASNDSSSENEKKVAFKQGFKNLEGVITVPEKAIDAFRIKVGLKELEV